MERQGQVGQPRGPLAQGRALGTAQETGAAHRPPARRAGPCAAGERARLYRAYLLKEQLRALYHLDDPVDAPAHLDAWLAWAQRSQLAPFARVAATLARHRDGILAAITLGLTNARLEGLRSKVRLLSHRSYGLHSAAALIALIYLCCAGITITPPLR